MARTSLLLSLALVLVIASSVSAHLPKLKNICPPTLSGIQSFPSLEISNFIEQKAKSAPNSVQFNTLFSICKTYSNHLSSFKVAGIKNVFGAVHAKYAMMTKAMFAAEAAVGVQGELAAKLGKSYTGMAGCFVKLEEKIAEISAKYNFNANSMLTQVDRDQVDECLVKLKGAIDVFVKVVTECSMKFTSVKQMGIPFGGGFVGGFAKNGVGFGSKMIGLSGHSQGEAKVGVQGHVEGRSLRTYYLGIPKRETELEGRSGIHTLEAEGEAKVGVQGDAEGSEYMTSSTSRSRVNRGHAEGSEYMTSSTSRSRVNHGGKHLN